MAKAKLTNEQIERAKKHGVSKELLNLRLRHYGWDEERAITEKPGTYKNKRSNHGSWYADNSGLVKCPFPECDHIADSITKAHCRTVHRMERDVIQKQYGMPHRVTFNSIKKAHKHSECK